MVEAYREYWNNYQRKNYCAREIDYVDFVKTVNNIIEIVNRNKLFEYA